MNTTLDDPTRLLQHLATLVVKRGVTLGNLSEADRDLVLALAATVLPVGSVSTEAQVNDALRRGLQAEAAFIDTDHVELRRWLVDAGFWQRDGYGKAYQRAASDGLAPRCRVAAEALATLDVPAWVAAQQARLDAEREARRSAWAARQGAAHGPK